MLLALLLSAADPQIHLTSAQNPAVFGRTISLTAVVWASDGSAPAGDVTFMADATTLGTAPLIANVATYDVLGLLPGTHTIAASFGTATATLMPPQHVDKAIALVTITLPADEIAVGTDENIAVATATTPPGDGTPTGTIRLLEDGHELGAADLNLGATRFSTAGFARGAHVIEALYSGDDRFEPARTVNVLRIGAPPSAAGGQSCASTNAWPAAALILFARRLQRRRA